MARASIYRAFIVPTLGLLLLVMSTALLTYCKSDKDPAKIAASMIYDVLREQQNPNGVQIINLKYDNCIEGSRRVHEEATIVGPHTECLDEDHYLWRFVGKQLKMSLTPSYLDGNSSCLDCYGGQPNCSAFIVGCNSSKNQQWSVKVFPHQIDYDNKRLYFSLMSELHTDSCLTDHTHNIRDWDKGANAKIEWSSYILDRCEGNLEQSFYLVDSCFDSDWIEKLEP